VEEFRNCHPGREKQSRITNTRINDQISESSTVTVAYKLILFLQNRGSVSGE